jgi:phage repressor protein C with HTH and peptisase S24 domain
MTALFSASLNIVNSAPRIPFVSALLNTRGMQKIEEIYRARLRMLVEEAGTQRALAERIQKSPAQISQWLNASPDSKTGKPRSMDRGTAREIERLFPKPEGWMDQAFGAIATDEPQGRTPYLSGFEELSIQVLANSGSMGSGDEQLHDEVVVGRLTVSPQWAARTIKPLTDLKNLRFIHGYGDSMDPTFADGDVLLVDIGVSDPKIDGVYVLEANDRLYIKRVRQRFDGQFEISSDNPTIKTVDVLDGSQQVNVRGRVVWAWNGKRL